MADVSGQAMVLRSVHMPRPTDEALRSLAFVTRLAKSELIRAAVAFGLAQLYVELRDARTPAEFEQIGKKFCEMSKEVPERTRADTMARFQSSERVA